MSASEILVQHVVEQRFEPNDDRPSALDLDRAQLASFVPTRPSRAEETGGVLAVRQELEVAVQEARRARRRAVAWATGGALGCLAVAGSVALGL